MDEEFLRKLGLSIARGVPQMATGMVDLAALPFTLTGLLDEKDVVGGTEYLTQRGLLPPPQEGIIPETLEMLSGALSPQGAATGGLLALGTMAGKRGAKSVNQAIKTAQDEAMEVAQRNASLPIEQGGLGLPKDNTAMDRAKAMGFDVDTNIYHGTNADISEFDVSGKGKTRGAGSFFTDNPVIAETYVSSGGGGNIMPVMLRNDGLLQVNARGENWNDIATNTLGRGNRRPLKELEPNDVTSTDEISMLARSEGYPGVKISNVMDSGPNSHSYRMQEYIKDKFGVDIKEFSDWEKITSDQFAEAKNAVDKLYKQKTNVTAIQDPTRVRSRFAAFDPTKRNLADILAGVGATGVGLGLLSPMEEEEQF